MQVGAGCKWLKINDAISGWGRDSMVAGHRKPAARKNKATAEDLFPRAPFRITHFPPTEPGQSKSGFVPSARWNPRYSQIV